MSKNTYWIADPAGVKAVVEGAAERDQWTLVHGWTPAAEPQAGDFVWMAHADHGGRARFPALAADQWTGLGWVLAGPSLEPDPTKDPVLVDQRPEPVAEPVKPKTTSATGGEQSKETSRG